MKKTLSCSLALSLALTLALPAAAAGPSFSDVPAGHWSCPFVERAAASHWVEGTGGGKFEPDARLTAAAVSVMLDKILFLDELDTGAGGEWWASYMTLALRKNLYANTGITAGEASADQEVTRFQIAQMAVNALTLGGYTFPDETSLEQVKGSITDFDSIPENYRDAALKCFAAGILSGKEGGNFDGGAGLTRAEAAVILCRLYDIAFPGSGGREESRGQPEELSQSNS